MFEFRSKQLKLPTQKDESIILGKYEATEKRLEELVEELSVADCAIKRIELFQKLFVGLAETLGGIPAVVATMKRRIWPRLPDATRRSCASQPV